MSHGFGDEAVYLNCGDTDKVVAGLVALFAAEGMRPTQPPAQRLNHESALENNLWAVIVFPGRQGWTVVKSTPWDLLCNRAQGAGRNRFFDLCKELRVPGVLLAAHGGSPTWGTILAEADGVGRERVCGWWYCDGDEEKYPEFATGSRFYGHRVEEALFETTRWEGLPQLEPMRFELLPHLQTVLQDSRNRELCRFRADTEFEIFYQYLGAQLGGRNGEFLSDRRGELHHTMMGVAPLTVADGTVLYFEWPAADRPQPRPSEMDLALERFLKEPHLFYADGSPVLVGDAVLYDHGMFPGLVTGFLVANMNGELRIAHVQVKALGPGERAEDALTGARQLHFVERNSPDFLKSGFDSLRRRARQGNAQAQFALGNLLVIGYGVPENAAEGLEWWRKAAAQGHELAKHRLGKLD